MATKRGKQPKRNPPEGFGSINGYAAHRKALGLPGGTVPAARKAIAAGRIPNPDIKTGWLNFAECDKAWANNTVSAPIQAAVLDDFREIPIDPKTGEPDWMCYPVGRRGTERLIWLKQRDYEQRLEQRAGVLVPRAKVRRALHDHARQRREEAFKIIPRLAQQLAKAKTAHEVEVILTGELTALFSEPILELEDALDPAA